jgi:A/G-specific adenine glycosylase
MKRKNQQQSSIQNRAPGATGHIFTEELLRWNDMENDRQMPWKGEKDPYRIWLSEVILQQTRVEQGLKYYENFIATFPDVRSLAAAPEEKVFKLWEGLGYYSRCRNLIASARYIANELGGVFPHNYEEILQLKGVGSYTAAAIASFAYNLPHAVLDGNVFRVLSRIFDAGIPIDTTEGKKYFTDLAQRLLSHQDPGAYNQAIMDFGATVCKPSPSCSRCFFQQHCLAFRHGRQELLPIKEKKTKVRERWLHYFVVECAGEVAIRQRTSNDIWQQLFEFPLVETAAASTPAELLDEFRRQYGIATDAGAGMVQEDQRLSHQLIHFSFFRLKAKKKENIAGCTWVKRALLHQYAFPKTLQQFLRTAFD